MDAVGIILIILVCMNIGLGLWILNRDKLVKNSVLININQPIKDETMETPPGIDSHYPPPPPPPLPPRLINEGKEPPKAPSSHRYAMCKDQLAQIDCVVLDCNYNLGAGKCSNVSPAISLNESGTFYCWSKEGRVKPQPPTGRKTNY